VPISHNILHAENREQLNTAYFKESEKVADGWRYAWNYLHQTETEWRHAIRCWHHDNSFENSGARILCRMQWVTYWISHLRAMH
jgi:hypothetical protein